MREPEIVVHDREELIFLLDEAAEIEHGLMCCYLYAMWSLKKAGEGLSDEQQAAVDRWRGLIRSVAIDEMLHLAVVSNLLQAVGAPPHFHRQNFPVARGYHPGEIVVELAPFDRGTLDHFIFLERPEGLELPDGQGFSHDEHRRVLMRQNMLMPTAQDYMTVGHFYRSLREAFASLADKLGERALFCGDPARQITPDVLAWDGLEPVTDVASAQRSIDVVVAQGEGTQSEIEGSHYWRFLQVRDEYVAMLAEDPSFEPAWPCARNPVQKTPHVPKGRVHVVDEAAACIVDLGNSIYHLMLRTLAQGFGGSDPNDARRVLVDAAIDGMYLVSSLGEALARLPANSEAHPGVHAGLSFAMTRTQLGLNDTQAAWKLLPERWRQLSEACRAERHQHESVGVVGDRMAEIAETIATSAPG